MEEMEFRFFERRDRFSERLQRFPGVEAGGRTPQSVGRTRTLRGIRLKDYKDRARKAGVELKKCEEEAPPVAEPDDEALGLAPPPPESEARVAIAAILASPITSATKPAKPCGRRQFVGH